MPHKSEFYMLGEIPSCYTHSNRCGDSNSLQKTLAATEYVSAAILLSFHTGKKNKTGSAKTLTSTKNLRISQ